MADETYRDFVIRYVNPPIPVRTMDWGFYHKDYDGEGDNRHGHGASVADCKAQIDDWWLERPRLSSTEQKAQSKRRLCRGTDEYCNCQNAVDSETRKGRAALKEQS